MTTLPPELIEGIRERKVILFAGAGISTSLGLPSWNRLMRQLATDVGFDEDIFIGLGDYLSLAEFYKLQVGDLGELRARLDASWHDQRDIVVGSRVHNAILAMDFPFIYTTNYDRLLEISHDHAAKPYTKIVTVRHLAGAPADRTQIIKFHGDFDSDESLVFTESDYFERLRFESPLDIRLRSDLLGRSILFIGYSLSDINIRLMFYQLTKLWASEPRSTARPPAYIFLPRPSTVDDVVLRERGISVLSSEDDDASSALATFLEELAAEVTRSI